MPPPRETCGVCVEAIPPSRVFRCPFCEYVCCKGCAGRYILGSPDDPNCMNCRRRFDRDQLCRLMSRAFVNGGLKAHREMVLFERETAMLPGTQVYVEQEIQRRKNVLQLQAMQKQRTALKMQLWDLERAVIDLQAQIVPPLEKERRQFTHRCGQPDCRGFLSTAWKCNVCERYTCSECNAPRSAERDDAHVCREEDVATARLLKSECRKCPGCAQHIFKLSGCDQMWCTACHTAFSWRTGRVINDTIHNPHFYEFERHNRGALGRALNDIPCGGMPTYGELNAHLRFARPKIERGVASFFAEMHRITAHVEEVEMPRFTLGAASNLDLRIAYMLGELDTASFRGKLQQREKKHEKQQEISMVLRMFVDTMADLYRQLIIERSVDEHQSLILALVAYTNETLATISRRFSCTVPQVCLDPPLRLYSAKR